MCVDLFDISKCLLIIFFVFHPVSIDDNDMKKIMQMAVELYKKKRQMEKEQAKRPELEKKSKSQAMPRRMSSVLIPLTF